MYIYIYIYIYIFVLGAPPLEDHLSGKETNGKLPYVKPVYLKWWINTACLILLAVTHVTHRCYRVYTKYILYEPVLLKKH